MMKGSSIALMCMCAVLATCVKDGQAGKSNVVYILADDLGFNEMGFQNNTRGLHTPNLDMLAHQGVILRNYYVQPICSPTRSSLMTGRYTIRLGTQSNVIYWDTPWGVPINETFIPQNLKDVGYNTAMFGKWHLGMFTEKYIPTSRGFDVHEGYYQGCGSHYTHVAACCTAGSPDSDQDYVCPRPKGGEDYRGYDWFRNGEPVPTANHTNSADLIVKASLDFIGEQKDDTPFFMYLPFQNVHGPHTCDPKFYNMYANRTDITDETKTLFGYITELDYAVGEIYQSLNISGFLDDTVFIFSSDNGGPPDGDADHQHGDYPGYIARNYPLKGWKTLIWEGGMRVAGFVSGAPLPESAKGTVYEGLMHVTDWLPTIVEGIAGGTVSRNLPLDGMNQWDAIISGSTSPRTEMLYNVNAINGGQAAPPHAGIRIGDYKLLSWSYNVSGINGAENTGAVLCPENEKSCDPDFKKGPILYNIVMDPGESNNIASENPDVVEKLLMRLKVLADQSVIPQQWTAPYQGDDYFCAKCPLHPPGTGPAAPWLPWIDHNEL